MAPKLLLADDSVTIQRVIELTFADENIEVIAVGDGQRAIERLESDRPDIVLADIGMPERDGYEVAAYVRSTPHLAHLPVLLLTGAFEPVDDARARAVGCDGVLVKPFEPQMVINRVRDLLAGGRSAARLPAAPAAGALPTDIQGLGDGLDVPVAPPAEGPAAGSDSLDEYFDRLDAAFAMLGSPAPEPPATLPESGLPAELLDFGRELPPARPPHEWDAPLDRDVQPPLPRAVPAAAAAPAAASPDEPRASSPAPVAAAAGEDRPASWVECPPLAEAFAALLAAEQQLGGRFAPTPAAITDEFVEQVTERVLARLGEGTVRESVTSVVLEVAERLVREEIARIQSAVAGR
jgi:CheY-like chemotaxis protein